MGNMAHRVRTRKYENKYNSILLKKKNKWINMS